MDNNNMMKYKPMLAYPVSKKPVDYNEKVYVQPKFCLLYTSDAADE